MPTQERWGSLEPVQRADGASRCALAADNRAGMPFRLYLQVLAVGVTLVLAGCAPVVAPTLEQQSQQQCRMQPDDQRWLRSALAAWDVARRDYLQVGTQPLPQIVTYDATCAYSIAAGGGSALGWTASPHNGQVSLPNGAVIPAGPNAVNAATEDGRNFLVMSLPSIWRAVASPSEIALDWFLEGVMLHELAHQLQSVVTPTLSFPALQRRYSLPPSVSDDTVEEMFKNDPAYVRAYREELDALYGAAAAPSDAQARPLACRALDQMRERRGRFFTGENAHLAAVDELSLTGEGLGQWVSYRWLTRGRGLDPALVLRKMRGGFFSQNQGLALFLVVNRLVPGWQRRVFANPPATAEPLLALACGRRAVSAAAD